MKMELVQRNSKIFYTIISVLILGLYLLPTYVGAQAGIVPACEGPTCNFNHLIELFVNIVRWAIYIGLTAVSGIFAYAGILYLTAGGDPGKVQKAHVVFQKVFFGAVLALSAFVIIDIILTGLEVDGTVTSKLPFFR